MKQWEDRLLSVESAVSFCVFWIDKKKTLTFFYNFSIYYDIYTYNDFLHIVNSVSYCAYSMYLYKSNSFLTFRIILVTGNSAVNFFRTLQTDATNTTKQISFYLFLFFFRPVMFFLVSYFVKVTDEN